MLGLLLVVLALAVGGCVCVVWAARGGPRWVRVVSRLTLGAAELVRHLDKNRKRNRSVSGDD
ncbi:MULTISPECIES: hypothetical protein [unclassified Streptomyces]|uniref:hypothetical protein n=1 Tax=unclassified Streptomyces TaxID=2593676 RepID=UPI001EDC0C10|nr:MULTISPECIES: hypothetical protein [unclassified Streptomyces]UKL04100.1 hypothetical protein L2I08_14845 [Streptomyces sp. NBU3104]